MDKCKKIIVEGRVQGVGYRSFIFHRARLLGLKGYVRNLYDGRVEIVAIGSQEAIASLLRFAYEGPSFASVIHIEMLEMELKENYENFEIRHEY